MNKTKTSQSTIWIRIILSILGGEIALVILTTIAQEVLFNGISWTHSSFLVLLLGGIATFIAAILAGVIARAIAIRGFNIVPIGLSALIIIETAYLITTNKTIDPIWFDVIAAASLIIGVWLGFYYKEWVKPKALS